MNVIPRGPTIKICASGPEPLTTLMLYSMAYAATDAEMNEKGTFCLRI